MQMKDETATKTWQRYLDLNKDAYGSRINSYAKDLADRMEKYPNLATMNDEEFAKAAEEAGTTADTDGITGYMYGAALHVLWECWVHGERLTAWHNKKYDSSQAEGPVNPAIVTIR